MKKAGLLPIMLFLLAGLVLFQADPQPVEASTAPAVLVQDIFQDVSRPAGITNNRVPEMEMAIGQAWGDYDNDGWVDLYVTDPYGPNTLYHSRGDGTFEISEFSTQVALASVYSGGAIFIDYDNDGWSDLYVVNWGENRLYRNLQGQGFEDVTAAAGVGDKSNGKTASWGDYNQDGFLDLYVANWACYPDCGRPSEGDFDKLYRNNGDGTFTDVSRLLGTGVTGSGFVASFTDYDNDGDPDIYLINDEFIHPIGNKLWRNDGPGCGEWCFKEVSREVGAAIKVFGMGLATGDYDRDGDFDFYFSNAGPMKLLQNQGDGTFKPVEKEAGVEYPLGIGWGTVFFDYDNDGWQDLYLAVANTTNNRDIAANPLFRNNGDGTFTEIACSTGVAEPRMSLGVAYADYDKDGWVDLVVGNIDEGYRLYRNTLGEQYPANQAQWLALELVGGGPVNRDAVGARVTLHMPDGSQQMQEIIAGASLGAGNELALYFGLGAPDAQTGPQSALSITVRWPNGLTQQVTDLSPNQRYQITYPESPAGQPGVSMLESFPHPTNKPTTAALPSAAAVPAQSGRMALALVLVSAGIISLAAWVGQARQSQSQTLPAPLPAGSAAPTPRRTWAWLVGAGVLVLAAAIGISGGLSMTTVPAEPASLDAQLGQRMAAAGVQPLTAPTFTQPLVTLGEALFWDPELSGNRDTSCATCHHPLLATGDGLSLPVGTGSANGGLGPERKLGIKRDFVPRNAPPVFNLGYPEWTVMFWDGRLMGEPQSGFINPASDRLPAGLDSILAAQAMFPITSRDEMRGKWGDTDIFGNPNELVAFRDYELRKIWKAVMDRLLAIPGYVVLFQAAFPGTPIEEMGFQHAANALAAYQAATFTFEDSPFDLYMRGDLDALSEPQKRGAMLFYGEAGCATCHSTGLLTDQKFYNLAVMQLGPGKGREEPLDLGRARETGDACDRFAFRTPPLRNVAITGPWMHNGAFTTLEAAVLHHLDTQNGLLAYDPNPLIPELRDTCQTDPATLEAVLQSASQVPAPATLTPEQLADLMAFLHALTSPSALDLQAVIPKSVPSGLTVGGN